MRINRYIASSGLCSRRGAEEYILSGKVKVNGKTVTDLATEINEENDAVYVEGQRIQPVGRHMNLGQELFFVPVLKR